MKVKFIAVLIVFSLAVINAAFSQNLFKNPESVVYDKSGHRYLVSNKGNGNIISVQKNGEQRVFNKDQESIRGLTISGGVLYAACNAGVAAFDLETGERLFLIDVKEHKFLNDITSDSDGNLYVSDTGGNKIYKINPKDKICNVLTENINGPNGLLFDKNKNRLLAVSWNKNGSIISVDTKSGNVSELLKTEFSGMDGLAFDSLGRIYVSAWGSGSVYRFDSEFKEKPVVVVKGYKGPADIFIKQDENMLIVPVFQEDRIGFVKIKD